MAHLELHHVVQRYGSHTVVDDVKPPAKPPVIAAPIVEAKLAGKTVTYNAKLSLKAWDFARRHTFEGTFARRIEHLRECAGLAPALVS